MRFMMIHKADANTESMGPPPPELMAALGQLIGEFMAAGKLVSSEGLMPSAMGARVDVGGGKTIVRDGPFAEAKELVAGYTLIQARSREEALEWSRRFPAPMGEGVACEIEVRPLYELEDFDELGVHGADRFRELGTL